MTTKCALFVGLGAILLGAVATPLHGASTDADAAVAASTNDTAVRSFWSTLDATWVARDAEQFSLLFTQDASFGFVAAGSSLEGRAAILQHFVDQFARQSPDLRHVTQVREIRTVAPGVVTVDGNVEVRRTGTGDADPTILRRFAIFAVMLKSGSEWNIHVVRAYRLSTA